MAAKVIFLIFTILFVSNLYSQEIGIVSSKQWTDNSEIENPAGLGVYLYLPVSKVGVQFEYSTAWNERIVKGNISSGFMNPAQNTIPERIRNNSTQQSLEFGLVIPEILNYNSFAFNIGGGFSVDWFSGERNGLESGPPLAGLRAHGYHQQEVFGEATIEPNANGKSRVVLELVVGGKDYRTETGEVCVALLSADGRSYDLLGAGSKRLPLTNVAIEPALVHIEQSLATLDDQRRRRAAASQDDFWKKRHDVARDWTKQHRDQILRPSNEKHTHSIDAFIAAKIERALAASAGTDPRQAEHFHGKVLPILREHCFRCHGEKNKGGLKLNSRDSAMKAGESEIPAVVPGDLEASELIAQIRSGAMPPTDDGLSKRTDRHIGTLGEGRVPLACASVGRRRRRALASD